jgi:hypothetical protein
MLFKEKRILLLEKKIFLIYPLIELLRHRVNSFDISITKEYIAVIKVL